MLNIGSTGGDFDPYVKFNAKAGRWYFKDGDTEKEVDKPTFVADFDNIKTGWLLFLEGQAPSKVWDESLTTPAEKPSDKHKRGFQVRLFSDSAFGGVVELASSSMHLSSAINDIYMAYDAQKVDNAGKLPVIACKDTIPMKDKMGTNYKPVFELVKWVDRPDAFGSNDTSAPAQVETPAPVASTASEF